MFWLRNSVKCRQVLCRENMELPSGSTLISSLELFPVGYVNSGNEVERSHGSEFLDLLSIILSMVILYLEISPGIYLYSLHIYTHWSTGHILTCLANLHTGFRNIWEGMPLKKPDCPTVHTSIYVWSAKDNNILKTI